MMPRRCDIVLSGAGPVGAALGCALAESGWATLLVRRDREISPATHGDRRGLALTLASQQVLSSLDVWPRLRPDAIGTIREIRIEDMDRNEVRFESGEIGLPGLGYVIEYDELMRALASRLAEHVERGALALHETPIAAFEPEADGVTLRLGETYCSARLVIAADGSASRLRDLAGLKTRLRPYDEGAIVTTVTTETAHQGVAWQRFLSTGPIALLPLYAPHERSLIWTVPLVRAQELVRLPDEGLVRELELACKDAVGAIKAPIPRQMFALTAARSESYIGPRLALVGDAAHQVHPLAGQGANLGLADAAALSELLDEARARRRDPGGRTLLRQYERWRAAANAPMITAIDWFHRLFPDATPALSTLRGASMRAFDQLSPLKRAAMRFASGVTGDLPKRCRPRP